MLGPKRKAKQTKGKWKVDLQVMKLVVYMRTAHEVVAVAMTTVIAMVGVQEAAGKVM